MQKKLKTNGAYTKSTEKNGFAVLKNLGQAGK
jgi:hypothetical protein